MCTPPKRVSSPACSAEQAVLALAADFDEAEVLRARCAEANAAALAQLAGLHRAGQGGR